MRPAGFEPATCGLGNRRSILLSYERGPRDVDFRPSPRMLSTEPFFSTTGPVALLKEHNTMPRAVEQVAVVTGGGRGIGRGIVKELAALQFSVVVNYRTDRESALSACSEATELGAPQAIALQADVADLASGRRLLRETLAEVGRIDLW